MGNLFKRYLITILIFFAVALPVAAIARQASYAVIRVPVADMFAKASDNSAVVSQAIYGTTVKVLQRSRSRMSQIQTPDDYRGWVEDNSLTYRRLARTRHRVEVKSLFAYVYAEPDTTKRKPLLDLPFGTKLDVLAQPAREKHRWIKIRLVNGGAAYIHRADVWLDSKHLSMRQMLKLSRQFIGLPYLWGGVSSYGFDCSGFTQTLYRPMGIHLPRDAGQQAMWPGFVPVAKKNLKPGDLIFFGHPPKQKGKKRVISHVGIYLGRNKQGKRIMIGATTYGKPTVHIDDIDNAWWTKLYMASRRLKS